MAGTLYLDHPGRGCHEYTKICFRDLSERDSSAAARVSRRAGQGTALPVLAAGGGSGRRPAARWTGQICPIMLTDITAFSAQRRSDEDRLALRRTMYDMLQRAFEAAGLPWRELHTEDRGDGTLIVIPPDTPATAVAAQALGHLAAALRQHNQSASDALRMQLRVALHAGPVIRDAQGVTGNAINQTARLVQARALRKHLNETQADLGVIVSAYIYDNVIRQHDGQPMAAADYRKIRFRVKESALTAWIHLTGAASE